MNNGQKLLRKQKNNSWRQWSFIKTERNVSSRIMALPTIKKQRMQGLGFK